MLSAELQEAIASSSFVHKAGIAIIVDRLVRKLRASGFGEMMKLAFSMEAQANHDQKQALAQAIRVLGDDRGFSRNERSRLAMYRDDLRKALGE